MGTAVIGETIRWPEPLTTNAAIIEALRLLGGVADDNMIGAKVQSLGDSGRYGPIAHVAKGLYDMSGRGILAKVRVERVYWCFTDRAWRELGGDGSAPRPAQGTFGDDVFGGT